MLYCEKAIVNCYNYGGAITLDIAISREKKETIAEKRSFPDEFMNTEKPMSGKDPVKFKKVQH